MDALKKSQSATKHNGRSKNIHVSAAASDLLHEGKKYANALYAEGVNKVNDAEESMKDYSDELLKKVQKNPLASVLIAGGIGFLLSALFRKS